MRFPLQKATGSKVIGLALSFFILLNVTQAGVVLAAENGALSGDIRVTVNPANIKESLPIPGGTRKVTMSLHDVDLQDALRALGQKGNFNVLIDESVTGKINVDLNNVSIQDALETLKACGNLVYEVQGKNLTVAEANSSKAQAFKKSTTRIFHLEYANAKVIADFLNSTIFVDRAKGGSSSGSAGGAANSTGNNTSSASGAAASSTGASASGAASGSGGSSTGGSTSSSGPVSADYNTNSLIVVGDPADIKVVETHLSALDKPRLSKTWRLSQSNVLDVAAALGASLFNEGQPLLQIGSTSSSGTTQPSIMRANLESISEGAGSAQTDAGSSGKVTGSFSSSTIRTRIQAVQNIAISPTGAIIMPDTRLNTLTLMGTAEQIELADSFIALQDRKAPQVVLEAALIEVQESTENSLGLYSGGNNRGVSFGSNNTGSAFTNAIGRTATDDGVNIFRISTNPSAMSKDFFYQLNAMLSKNKAKLLANPTMITSNDNEGIIKIVDEIISSVTVTAASLGTASSVTYNIGEVGIILNILPKIGANKTVSMRVRPIISTVHATKTDSNGNIVTLLSKRETLNQNVQVADGETFVLGGLLHNTSRQTVLSNPMLSKLPILGALARNTDNAKKRSELIILITPHVINDESELSRTVPRTLGPATQPATFNGFSSSAVGSKGFVPVSFSGSSNTSNSALPPMMPTHAFDRKNNGTDPLEGKPYARPLPIPSGALLPDEIKAAPEPTLRTTKASVISQPASPKFMSTESTTAVQNNDLSDDKIRAIMDKLK